MSKKIVLICVLVIAVIALLIVANNAAKKTIGIDTIQYIKQVFPESTGYKTLRFTDSSGYIQGVYEAKKAGYVYKVAVEGFHGTIEYYAAIDSDGLITDIKYIRQRETPGIGTQITEPDFLNTVLGNNTLTKFMPISGATISSTAFIRGMDSVRSHYNTLNGVSGAETAGRVPVASSYPAGSVIDLFSFDNTAYQATVKNRSVDGDLTTYVVSSRGYGMICPEENEDYYKDNVFSVTVDTAAKKIERVDFTEFGDTPGIGSVVQSNQAYLDHFAGLSFAQPSVQVDTVSHATWTSTSLIAAVRAAVEAGGR